MKQLIQIQKDLKAPKNQHNKFGDYKYRSCEDILEAVKPILGECILTLSDEVKDVAGIPYVEATATFKSSNEEISVKAQAGINPNTKGMSVAQCFGASSSYARKYALAGLFLLDDTKDADTQDNTDQNKPPTKKEVDKIKGDMLKAHQDGNLKEFFFKLNEAQQEAVRGYANELRQAS